MEDAAEDAGDRINDSTRRGMEIALADAVLSDEESPT
jgi:hypothetical protein